MTRRKMLGKLLPWEFTDRTARNPLQERALFKKTGVNSNPLSVVEGKNGAKKIHVYVPTVKAWRKLRSLSGNNKYAPAGDIWSSLLERTLSGSAVVLFWHQSVTCYPLRTIDICIKSA
jgi:hypothetical protein